MTSAAAQQVLLTLDVALLRTSARGLGRDRARVVAIAVATWATIGIAVGGVVLALGVRLGVVAGLPMPTARAIVVAVILATILSSVVRLACASGLAPRLARPDALRTALDVTPSAGAAVGSVIHVWMLCIAIVPLAVTWSAWDPAPEMVLAVAASIAVAAGGCVALARASSDRRERAPRAGAVLGSAHRTEVAAVGVGSAVVVASMLPTVAAAREVVVASSASLPWVGHDIAASAVVAGAAMLVASDRLLDPRARARLSRAIALVAAGATPASVVVRLVGAPIAVWSILGVLGIATSLAWGVATVQCVGVGGAILAVGATAEALAMGVRAPAARIVGAALAVAVVAIVPSWATVVLAALTVGTMAAVTSRGLRCPPS